MSHGKPGSRDPRRHDVVDELLRQWRNERPDLDASAMTVVGRVLRLGKKLEARAKEALAAYGLSYTELDVLATLRRSGKPYTLRPGQLQRSVLLTSGAMTACLDRLEAAGLVVRAADPDDRRSLAAALTPAGRKRVDTAIAARFAEAAGAIEALTPAERRQLAALLRKLEAGLDERRSA